MRRTILLLSPFLLLGLVLTAWSHRLASWYDRHAHREELLLSRASSFLEENHLEDYENALQDALLSGAGSKALRAIALYNLGCSSLNKVGPDNPGASKDAMFYFTESLRNDPTLLPAKYNLELLMRRADDRSEQQRKKRPSSKGEGDEKHEKVPLRIPIPGQRALGDNP